MVQFNTIRQDKSRILQDLDPKKVHVHDEISRSEKKHLIEHLSCYSPLVRILHLWNKIILSLKERKKKKEEKTGMYL